ncbi:Sister chromatid cohesion protein pds5 [Neophaeococcomyces mojaviensis]|uniref:Sister chromatid cohesion protein pds5 n=1 Tax=Neophaeococcomyces mojaviensis TaxID=3383035 RepID=A0ACC3ALF2_9EURO|nr:Sister chromatid cohesion protein pds5 [Knufia sp. JES_112]
MPGRLRQAPRATEAEAEEGPYNVPGLEFNEPLTWRAGKAIPVAELFSRLQALSNELRSKEEEVIDVKDIAKLAQDLVNPNLLGHKDKGIRAWTVCCVVDVLMVCAPNAPYRPQQLKDIFTVIVGTILPALGDPSNAYNAQHTYILQQLVEAQSIVLISDVPDSEQLLSTLFTVCFDIVSGSGKNTSGTELAKLVEFQIQQLLTYVVEEATLPQDVTDIIISQFVRVDPRSTQEPSHKKKSSEPKDKTQSTLLLKDYPPAYNLAKGICAACSEKMSASISQYYSSIITNASVALADEDGKSKPSKRPLSPDSDGENDDSESLHDLRKAHRLVRELWRAAPDMLTNVIPQLEIELAADSIFLRQLAVETIGDMVAGIGLAGLPDLPALDPAQHPLPTIEQRDETPLSINPLLKPAAPKPFMHVHSSTYQAFLGRRIDKAVAVRVAWSNAASRILLTKAGDIGMNADEQKELLSSLTRMLKDIDEKVRLAALQSLRPFSYTSVVDVLGSDGGLSQNESLLSTIAERVLDKKLPVREQAMLLLGSMWGVASRDLANGNDQVRSVLAQAPSKLLSAIYAKDPHTAPIVDRVLYECLLPLSFPPTKGKNVVTESQRASDNSNESTDPDAIRVQRTLTLVRDLDERAKPVFFGMQKRQADMSKAITAFLKACEEYNGGISDDSEETKRLEEQLTRFIDSLARQQPDAVKASNDLWKFAKAHDRRNYQLIRFAMGPEHDYRTMTKAIKELSKRIRESGAGSSSLLDTLTAILYQCSLIVYNRSHIPAIMEYARSPDMSYADAAQEILREISAKVPEVMKTHIQVLCQELEEAAPSQKSSEGVSAVDALKACAVFSKRFPDNVPKSRKFELAMMQFVQFSSSPKAAKHATSIILNTSDKKELRAKEIVTKAVKRYGSDAANRLAQLAAIAQVCLLSPQEASVEEDSILQIVFVNILHKNKSPSSEQDQAAWSDDIDEETAAKQLALKILVNRCRSGNRESRESFDMLATPVIEVLMKLVHNNGEITPTEDTPATQRNHLRLDAARFLLKLCRHQPICEEFVTPQRFMSIAHILINPPYAVRRGLIHQLKKYLSQNKLNVRWMTVFFLLAFEPTTDLKQNTLAWLKSRSTHYARLQKQARSTDKKTQTPNVMEMIFARLLSMLVHHPDYPTKDTPEFDGDLLDFAKYIVFYLQACATEENLSLIFHIAQRVKQAQDALSDDEDVQERLYVLSDLAQATIRNYADLMPAHAKGINLLQTWPGKAHLPSALFKPINGHAKAQEIAAKNYLPEDVALGLEQLVRKMVRNAKHREGAPKPKSSTAVENKKRKSSMSIDLDDDEADETRKSVKKSKSRRTSTLPIRKTPQAKKRKSEMLSVEQPSRKSARTSRGKSVNYVESDEDEEEEDDAENVVKYKPAPMMKKTPKKATPELDEDEQDHDRDVDEDEAFSEAASDEVGSPTPRGKQGTTTHKEDTEAAVEEEDQEAATDVVETDEESQDTEMTNGDEQAEKENSPEKADEDEDMDDDQNGEEEPEETTEQETTPLKENANRRTTRRKGLSTTTAKTVPKSKSKGAVASKGRAGGPIAASSKKAKVKPPVTQKKKAPTPEPAPTRRATRRTKT